MSNCNERLVSGDEAAKILGVTPHTLNVWRCCGRYNLPYVKVGRLVKYKLSEINAFIERRSVEHPVEAA